MRSIRLSCLALFALLPSLQAQQRPHYTQYILNNYILNPAITGIENYADLRLSMRKQWVGIDGAPSTFYGSVHTPIGKQDFRTTATSFGMKGENPRGRQYWLEYSASPPHHGVGLSVMNYRTGYINRSTIAASYAYHVPLGLQTTLSAGFAAGFTALTLDRTKITLAIPSDPAIGSVNGQFQTVKPELNAGLWLYSKDYFVGLSALQVIPSRFSLVDNSLNASALVPHLIATAGYRFFLTNEVSLMPSVMVRYIDPMPVYLDVNAKFQYLDRVWLGGSFRMKDGFAGMAGLNISQTFNVSYSYDFTPNQFLLGTMQRGTHEIVLGFLLNNRYGDMCPRNVW